MGMELKVETYCVVQEILMENAYYQTLYKFPKVIYQNNLYFSMFP